MCNNNKNNCAYDVRMNREIEKLKKQTKNQETQKMIEESHMAHATG